MSHITHVFSEQLTALYSLKKYMGTQRVFYIKSDFGLFALHRHGMHGLKKSLQNPFSKDLEGPKNFTSSRKYRRSMGKTK